MILIYRIVFLILKSLLFILKPFLGSKMQQWISLRSMKPAGTLTNSYWFHASSGEIEYVKSVIIETKKQQPNAQIIVSYSSPSAEKLFENIRPYVNVFEPLPWDQPTPIRSFIKAYNPQVLVFSRTDFWPELIYQANQAGIPIAVVSYFGRLTGFRKTLNAWLFKKVKFISTVEPQLAAELQDLLPSIRITCDGDTRFDQVFWRLEQTTKVTLRPSKKVFIAGSTWPEDEAQLASFFNQILQNGYQIIWSPHEVGSENIQRILSLIEKQKCSHQLLSSEIANFKDFDFKTDFLVVDRIGYLADLYRYADIAFVGGSFKEKVHSVMEPLCSGLPVLIGPHYKNNPEAVKYANKTNPQAVYVVHNDRELLNAVDTIQMAGAGLKDHIKSTMLTNKNATQKITSVILNTVLKK